MLDECVCVWIVGLIILTEEFESFGLEACLLPKLSIKNKHVLQWDQTDPLHD
jgi:hypothetical protein